ncbi:IS3 family transposase [Polynucleobacter sp. 39-46-10]|uniref:IS3 family transposase n=1 Tax=Polynucleobacter sp. 39-46-10 TaxID=1970428 RepID=UPI0025FC4DFA|nr:IS3 family transposase [Polynucleobacter sp. 39-46-10]
MKCAFIKEHRQEFRLLSMCQVLKVHHSGYYTWLKECQSLRALENAKLSAQIRYHYDQSMGIYGSPQIYHVPKEAGISCSKNRVARLMKASQLRSIRGYKRPRYRVGRPALVSPNQLQRKFTHEVPDQAWVTDITYIRTYEGWLYLTVVIDLQSRLVVGWIMQARMQTRLVLDALTMAIWRR